MDALVAWKNKPKRRPVLLQGARQVGKTYIAEQFGAEQFSSSLTVNFQTNLARLTEIFSGDLSPQRILEQIGFLYGTVITKDTLLILDEIQLCQPAVAALAGLAEYAPAQPILATTSYSASQPSFSDDTVDLLGLFPMDFEEFCWAAGREDWPGEIRESYATSTPFVAHSDAMVLYRHYTMVGGLPAAVKAYVTNGDWRQVRETQREVAALYTLDMRNHLDDATASWTRSVWDSVPKQLLRERASKFKLSDVRTGARTYYLEAPIAYLDHCGLILRHYRFPPTRDGSYYKVYLNDVGLLSAQLGVRPDAFLEESTYQLLSPSFRGALAKNYVRQSLEANLQESMYWRSPNTAAIDFTVMDGQMRLVPIDVQASDNVRSRSLGVFRDTYNPPLAIRLSGAQFGYEDGLKSVPLYAAFCLTSESVTG